MHDGKALKTGDRPKNRKIVKSSSFLISLPVPRSPQSFGVLRTLNRMSEDTTKNQVYNLCNFVGLIPHKTRKLRQQKKYQTQYSVLYSTIYHNFRSPSGDFFYIYIADINILVFFCVLMSIMSCVWFQLFVDYEYSLQNTPFRVPYIPGRRGRCP